MNEIELLVSDPVYQMNRKKISLALITVALAAWLFRSTAFAQSTPELIYETREHILDDAKREGKLLVSREGQEILDTVDPGRASSLIPKTLAHKLATGANVAICAVGCRDRQDDLMKRIAVDA